MPTYDYKCEACGHAFEKFQSMSAGHLKKCPECGKPKLVRLIGTGAGVIFKGGGFYETDYRGDGYQKAADKESGKSDGKTDKKDAKSDTTSDAKKPDTKADKPATKSDTSGDGKKPKKSDT